ncbi:MAG: CBS domain-containing protein [Deltaproteobacteria bacterium]
MKVCEVMSACAASIVGTASLTEAAARMKAENVGLLPVVTEEVITGIITDRDIVIRGVAENLDLNRSTVAEIMSDEPILLQTEHEIEDAARLMAENKVRRVIIVDEGHRPVGILSLGDLAVNLDDEHMIARVLSQVGERSVL